MHASRFQLLFRGKAALGLFVLLCCHGFHAHGQNIELRFGNKANFESFCQVNIMSTFPGEVMCLLTSDLTYNGESIVSSSYRYEVRSGYARLSIWDIMNRGVLAYVNHEALNLLSEKWAYLDGKVSLCVRLEPLTDIAFPASECSEYTSGMEAPHLVFPFDGDTLEYIETGLGFVWTRARCRGLEVLYQLEVTTLTNTQADTLVLAVSDLLVSDHAVEDIRKVFHPNTTYEWTVTATCKTQVMPAYETWRFHFREDKEAKYYSELKSEPDGGATRITDGKLRFIQRERYGTNVMTAAILDAETMEVVKDLENVVPSRGKNYYEIDVSCVCLASGYYVLQVHSGKHEHKYLLFSIDKALMQNHCTEVYKE